MRSTVPWETSVESAIAFRAPCGSPLYGAVIRPVLTYFCTEYPDATVEVIIDYAFRDLVSGGFDAGIRLGEKLEQDMVAVPVGPALRMAVVASPEYLSRHPAPSTPADLQQHRCINYRMETAGGLYSWEFEYGGRKLKTALSGPLTFNEPDLMLRPRSTVLALRTCWRVGSASYRNGASGPGVGGLVPPVRRILPLLPVAQAGFSCVGSVVEALAGTIKPIAKTTLYSPFWGMVPHHDCKDDGITGTQLYAPRAEESI